jgi:predicted ATPase
MNRIHVVLPGAPGSGKSTALGDFGRRLSPSPICVPEAARWAKEANLLPPRNPLYAGEYEVAMSQIRIALEKMARVQERRAKHIIIDRGIPDAASYLPGGLAELCELLKMSREAMFARYDLVLFFLLPSREIYDLCRPSNPSRHETYEQALVLEARGLIIWSGHPNFHLVKDGPNWESRFGNALNIVRRAA